MATHGGLRPYSSISGFSSHVTREFAIASGTSSDLFQGDIVKLVNDGTVVAMSAAGDTPVVGVFVGCSYTNSEGTPVYSNKYTDTITAEDIVANVIVDPFQLYSVQIANSDADTTLTRTAIGLNYDVEFNAGDSTSGLSGMVLDSGVTGITGAANLRCVGLTNDDGTGDNVGDGSTTYSKAIVMIDPQISFWLAGPGL